MGGPAYGCCHGKREIRERRGGGGRGSGGHHDVPPREGVGNRSCDGPHTTLDEVSHDSFANTSGDDKTKAGGIWRCVGTHACADAEEWRVRTAAVAANRAEGFRRSDSCCAGKHLWEGGRAVVVGID